MKRMRIHQPSMNYSQQVAHLPIPGKLPKTEQFLPTATVHDCSCDGGCPRCLPIQAKLKISAPDDPLEQEADQIAQQITTDSPPAESPQISQPAAILGIQRACPDGQCPLKQLRQDEEEFEIHAQLKPGSPAPGIQENRLFCGLGPGQPLPVTVRNRFEDKLQNDFSAVRIHADPRAVAAAEQINALAFTRGTDIVFNHGQYCPNRAEGDRLLAHELVHVVQQQKSGPSRVQKKDKALTKKEICPTALENGGIEKIVVEQEMPQTVSIYYNDGSVETDICSTGKGLCCVDKQANPDGVACTVAQSNTANTYCTPIGDHVIKSQYPERNGWKYWSDIVPDRGVGLHQHDTVTGKPLSHGCIRMHEEMAKKIYCGSIPYQTPVQVRGFSRPYCDDADLQEEWGWDIPRRPITDGDLEDPRSGPALKAELKKAREIFEPMYNKKLTDEELYAITMKTIPRCGKSARQPTAEENQLRPTADAASATTVFGEKTSHYENAQVTLPQEILAGSALMDFWGPFYNALNKAGGFAAAKTLTTQYGKKLWEAAKKLAQAKNPDTDDRPLYWMRIEMQRAIHQFQPKFAITDDQREELIQVLDQASRGMASAAFSGAKGVKRILISGFDPFQLDRHQNQGNPSGAVILALDGKTITAEKKKAEIQGVIFPVSETAFDTGMVENFFKPYLTGKNPADMIILFGMGSSRDFEVEGNAGPIRSGAQNLAKTETPQKFHATSLPVDPMRTALRGKPDALVTETAVTEILPGQTEETISPSGPTPNSTAVEGTAGTYMCNEIFYRLSLLREQSESKVPMGFVHTPLLDAPVEDLPTTPTYEAARDDIIRQVENMIKATLPAI